MCLVPQSPFNNSYLFSNHYLEKLVQNNPEWQNDEDLKEAFAAIKGLYERKIRVLENYNESQLEENFIRPVLRALGHFFGVQGKVLGKDRTPDYAFFPDQESLDEAESNPENDYYLRAVAVGDAKAWKVSLDKRRMGAPTFEMQNPSYQIDVYLKDTPPKWGILTNGRFWRLYHESTSYKLDTYYEVDLSILLQAGDLEAFKYFYMFFRREAFPKVVDGECFLDRVREGSEGYAQEIGEDLKENVYNAMKILAEGFLAEGSNKLTPFEDVIQDVQENALRLLYRLLFIYYAESRRLLDTENKYYYELSLQKQKTEVAGKLDRQDPLLSVSYSYWDKLKNLFNLINDGSESRKIPKEEFYIPAYNGGLFDPKKNRFLEEKIIGDVYLARAIDLLARSGEDRKRGFVDYSSLEIRHLGSIYEGLLEYRLKVADEDIVALKEKGKEVWLPTSEAGNRKVVDQVHAGEIYLATDKGERKATGSYYTPEYIVKYIVKNTIEPIIEKKKQKWLGTSRPFAEYVLSIKVLDPAMGSGHFLVEATDQLARWLVQAWATARPEEIESKEVAEQDVQWARREVVRNCIYGVDLNPMAVELAKLSLWLKTVASNKPLSFLDHHLRCGNSLIGAKLDGLMALPNSKRDLDQLPMWQFVLKQQKEHTEDLLKQYADMAARPDDNLKTVKEKEKKYGELREEELSRRLTDLADIWLSTFFGNEVDEEEYQELQNYLSPRRFLDWSEFRTKEWFARAKTLASEKRFFHWELEFPEALAGKENAGFDVVIGNPPYVRQERLGEDKNYLESKFKAYHSIADLYVYFIERGVSMLNSRGVFSYIVANKWMRANYGEPLRTWMKELNVEEIIDFGDLPVFSEATTYPCILRISNGIAKSSFKTTVIETLAFKSLDIYVAEHKYTVDKSELNDSGWSLVNESIQLIIEKLHLSAISLGEYINGKIYRGILTGLNEAFVIDENTRKMLIAEDPKSSELIKPFLFGRDIKHYEPPDSGHYLILIPNGWTQDHLSGTTEGFRWFQEAYPAISNHLSKFSEDAQKRYDKGVYWWELRPCDYYKEFENPKIIYAEIATRGQFTLDVKNCFSDTTSYILGSDSKYLLGILNSTLWTFLFSKTSSEIRGGFYRWKRQYMSPLPIRRISFTTPEPDRARKVAELKQLYQASKFDDILADVEACLPKDAQGNFISEQEKSDVVHDLLAFLAEQMLEMNKQKQAEIKGFLRWLEGEVGAKVEDLTPKTKVQEYHKLQFDELLAILKKNKRKIAIDPARREPQERLRAEFDASVGKLKPLMERIAATDGLIDQIVYKLYGLTEEEIGIVEGNVK